MQQHHPLWTKTFVRLSIINFSVILVFYLLMITMASYASVRFEASTSSSGLIVGIYIVGAVAGRLLTSRLMHRFSENRLMKFGLATFSALVAGYFFANSLAILAVVRFLHGAMAGIALTGLTTQITKALPLERKSEGISYFSMSTTVGTAIGPFFGIYLGSHTSYAFIFSACLIVSLLAFFLSLTVTPDQAKGVPEKSPITAQPLIEPKVLPIALMMVFLGAGYAVILSFLNVYASERDMITGASLFFVVYAVIVLVTRPLTGKWMDQKGLAVVMIPAFISFAIGLAIISMAHSTMILLVAALFVGLGFGNLQSGAQALAISKVRAEATGVATSTYFIGMDTGLGLSPYLLGLIVPFIGYSHTYAFMSIVVFAVFIVYYFKEVKVK